MLIRISENVKAYTTNSFMTSFTYRHDDETPIQCCVDCA